MKDPIDKAPAHIYDYYRRLRDGAPEFGITADPLLAVEAAADADYLPDPPKMPAHDQLKAATENGDFRSVIRIRRDLAYVLERESAAALRYKSLMRCWANEPRAAESAAAARAARQKAELEEAIERRARDYIAQETQSALERARERARAELAPAEPAAPARGRSRKESV